MHAEDFPTLAAPADDAPQGVVRADAFARLVTQVARAASSDEGRPVLTGVQLEAADGTPERGRDGQLSARGAIAGLGGGGRRHRTRAVPVAPGGGQGRDRGRWLGHRRPRGRAGLVPARRPAADDQAHRGDLPELPGVAARRASRPPSWSSVQRWWRLCSVCRSSRWDRRTRRSTLTFGDGTVELQASNQEMGDASESLPAEIDGEGLSIAFNPTFLLAGLDATGTERIRIELRDGLKPAVIRGPGRRSDATRSRHRRPSCTLPAWFVDVRRYATTTVSEVTAAGSRSMAPGSPAATSRRNRSS
jgi:DNA polymerase III subunit beta